MPVGFNDTNIILNNHKQVIPRNQFKYVAQRKLVYNYKYNKDEPNQTRLIVGGNRINYPDDCGIPTPYLITVKILLRIVLSTTNAEFMTLDIFKIYLNTPLVIYKYIRLKMSDISEEVIV